MPQSPHGHDPTTLEEYLRQFLAIEGVSPEEAMQFALHKEQCRLLLAADSAEPQVAELLRKAAAALTPLRSTENGPREQRPYRPNPRRYHSQKHDKATLLPRLQALIAGGQRLGDAAKSIGISYGTAYAWLKAERYYSRLEGADPTAEGSEPPT